MQLFYYTITSLYIATCIKSLLENQLFSPNLLRLLRTGALVEVYSSNEDEDFDVSITANF